MNLGAQVTVFLTIMSKMAFDLVNGLVFNAAPNIPCPKIVASNWTL